MTVDGVPLLRLESVSKGFPGVQALDDVRFDLFPGEVHALMGENGAGKSTLMKIVSGVEQPDSGTIEVDGSVVTIRSPIEAQRLGIATIFQELTVLDNLDVGRNVMLAHEPTRRGRVVWNELYADASAALDELGIDLDVRTPLERLGVGSKQMVEITRAARLRPRVLIMDEPTSSLGRHEEERLLELVEQLAASGVGIVYISHRMDEVFRLADRITVLRNGRWVATRSRDEIDRDEVIRLMVGRDVVEERLSDGEVGSTDVMTARGLRRGEVVRDVDLTLRAGEVVGMAGLVGAGRTEVARLLFGADHLDAGEIHIDGELVDFGSPSDAIAAGVAYVPEDRKALGLVLSLDVEDNLALPTIERHRRGPFLGRSSLRAAAVRWIERLRIKTPSPRQATITLSGGNQQKIVVAKWLATDPQVLILDEPTRGIDVGAKREIHDLIRSIAADGVAVLVISSELPEVLTVSDRIVVMHEGRVSGELDAVTATEEQILTLAFGRDLDTDAA